MGSDLQNSSPSEPMVKAEQPGLSVHVRQDHEKVVIVEPEGALDADTASDLHATLMQLWQDGAARIVIDGKRLDYMNSDGLGSILEFVPRLRKRGGDLKLACFSGKAHTIIELLGLDQVLQVFASLDEAIAAFDRPLPDAFSPTLALAASARGKKVHALGCRFLRSGQQGALRFFSTVTDAQRAGLSPCRVCEPEILELP